MRYFALSALLLLPAVSQAKTLKQIVDDVVVPIGDIVIGLLFLAAFLFFLAGMARFFFTGSEEGRTKGKKFAIWGIIGLVAMFSVWGAVHVLLNILTDFT